MCKRIVYLRGGLGNQMFQYAFFLALHEKQNDVYCDDTNYRIQNEHNGMELESLFGISCVMHTTNMLAVRELYKYFHRGKTRECSIVISLLNLLGIVLDTT